MTEPPVEPAEPPTNISATSVISASADQKLKSALAKPVVVIIETAWKTDSRTAASPSAMPSVQSSSPSSAEPPASTRR